MKLKSNCKPVPINMGFKIPKMHGHMYITLRNVKTGEVEEYHEDNLITNAILWHFANCGMMNYPNVDLTQLVPTLMGGIMCFDDTLYEDANNIYPGGGVKMIANATQGFTSNVDGEQGTATANTAETTYNGWQADGSYTHTYEWNTGQGNGTINCVCLAEKNYSWAGEGNSTSLRRHTTKTNTTNLCGNASSYSGIPGQVFKINMTDSTCYSFAIETRTDQEEQEYTCGVLRQYRLPISKLDLRGTPSAPVMLSEQEVTLDADFLAEYASSNYFAYQPHYMDDDPEDLLIWNVQYKPSGLFSAWGSGFTQYLWKLDASTGTLTKTTVTNTSGDTLYGMAMAIFNGNYCYFLKHEQEDWTGAAAGYHLRVYGTKIYVWNRTSGVMTPINNPYGADVDLGRIGNSDVTFTSYNKLRMGFALHHGEAGKIITMGEYPVAVDAVDSAVYPTNATTSYNTGSLGSLFDVSELIYTTGLNLYRGQGYIASINNLEAPVVKTSEKTMKIVYRITFEEEEE